MGSIKITFPDGAIKDFPKNTTGLEIAKSISEGLARNVLAVMVNEEVWDATRSINNDASIKLLTWNDPEGKSTFWHSSAHLMAEALEALYPGIKFGIGPPIENGFYYDVDLGEKSLGEEQFIEIESKMKELAKQKNEYIREEVSKQNALEYFNKKEDPYKLELIDEL